MIAGVQLRGGVQLLQPCKRGWKDQQADAPNAEIRPGVVPLCRAGSPRILHGRNELAKEALSRSAESGLGCVIRRSHCSVMGRALAASRCGVFSDLESSR